MDHRFVLILLYSVTWNCLCVVSVIRRVLCVEYTSFQASFELLCAIKEEITGTVSPKSAVFSLIKRLSNHHFYMWAGVSVPRFTGTSVLLAFYRADGEKA